jgi:hypothetical protein
MRHEAVEVVAAESPFAEGTHVDVANEVGIILAGLQPPKNLANLGVLGLVIAVDIVVVHLFHRNTK